MEGVRFGQVAQRKQTYNTDLEIQRGFLLGFIYENVDCTAYLFNPDQDKPTVLLAAVVNF